ncbi:hypothetical protein, conserved [Plasmodium vivax]|nr:hypothetical protein, conserved [Plasmodium vivax]
MEKLIYKFEDFFYKYKSIFDMKIYENNNIYDEQCNKPNSIYPVTSISFSTDCIKCMKYLQYLDDKLSIDDQKQGIIYLYLWLYNYEVKNRIFNGKTISNFKKLMESFGEVCSTMVNIHNIYSYYVEKVLNYELNDLFCLYKKFDKFQNNQECESNRCDCAKECVDTYKNSLEKCYTNRNIFLCNELEHFRSKFDEVKPSASDCPGVDLYLSSYKKFSTPVIILISFITISVLSSLLFILYKFTPFGSRFRFRNKRPQRIYSNFTNEEANLLYTKGKSKTPEAKPYNIAYNSI